MSLARTTGWPPSEIKALTPYEMFALVAILKNEANKANQPRM